MKKHFNWALLAILALAQFMVVLDTSIVNVALPAIEKALHFSTANLQWVITAYTLCFGGFLLLGGRAADLYGRRRMFILGIAGFTLASLAVGLSQSSGMAIVFRGIQGLFAAFMSPAALSIVLTSFTGGKERNTALGVWAAVAAGGAAAGVLFGGLLTQYFGWRWDFFVNIPVGIFVVFMALKLVPPHAKEVEHNDLDLPGAVLVTSGLMTLVYTLVKAPQWGWLHASTIEMFALSAALLAGFLINESRVKHPLMPLSIFRIRNVSAANLAQLPITAGMFSMFFFLSLYIQMILGYSPVISGLCYLPITIIIGITAPNAAKLIGKIGFKPLMIVAPLLMAAGLTYLSRIPVDGTYWVDVFPGLALMAVGMGLSFVSITVAATSGVPGNESGLASGLLNTSQQIGGALGLAILSGVAASRTQTVLAGSAVHNQAAQVNATVQGYHSAFHIGIAFALTASLVAAILVRNQRHHDAAPTAAH
ncbi:MAG TPA: MFS transporter [Patescibacteria group bacterium]|nr:MFS transporter [Patescibacteria group bacterium]